eukprot:scaffold5422_cov128-Skeletonema_marinoi.AAC.1
MTVGTVSGTVPQSYPCDTMKNMFKGASTFNADIKAWDTFLVTDMEGMFQGAAQFNAAISNWDTSSVITMKNMFAAATVVTSNDSVISNTQ